MKTHLFLMEHQFLCSLFHSCFLFFPTELNFFLLQRNSFAKTLLLVANKTYLYFHIWKKSFWGYSILSWQLFLSKNFKDILQVFLIMFLFEHNMSFSLCLHLKCIFVALQF